MKTPIEIVVTFPAFFRPAGVQSGERIELPAPRTVKELLTSWGVETSQQRHVTPIVNERQRSLDYELQNGDEVFFYIPVGGG